MGRFHSLSARVLDCVWTQAELLVQAFLAPLLLLLAPLAHVAYLLGGRASRSTSMKTRPPTNAYLITGASQGIGAALAVRLAKDPATCALYLVGRDEARMDDTRRICVTVAPSRATRVAVLKADVQDRDNIRRVILEADQSERDVGRVGLTSVVANAGISQNTFDPTSSAGFSAATTILNVNMMGTIHTVEPVVDLFASRGFGQIVIVSSMPSFFSAAAVMTAYGSSKVAQRVFGECLRSTFIIFEVADSITKILPSSHILTTGPRIS
jgi:NAD(P)-dependent dehydrogenase (short-subunit alcohol dehydrogenase family)